MLTQKKLLQIQLQRVQTELQEKIDDSNSKKSTDEDLAKAQQEIQDLTAKYHGLLKQMSTITDLVDSNVDKAATLLKSTDPSPPPAFKALH